MNYGVLGSVGKSRFHRDNGYEEEKAAEAMAKESLGINRRKTMNKRIIEKQQYMDKMKRGLNDCFDNSIKPYWRNH